MEEVSGANNEMLCVSNTPNHGIQRIAKSARPLMPSVIQKMILQFKSINNQEPGILASLLFQSYADLIKSDPIHWKPEEKNWNDFDREAFGNPKTVGACVFLSWHGQELVGFASFDPHQRPLYGIIKQQRMTMRSLFQRRGCTNPVDFRKFLGNLGKEIRHRA